MQTPMCLKCVANNEDFAKCKANLCFTYVAVKTKGICDETYTRSPVPHQTFSVRTSKLSNTLSRTIHQHCLEQYITERDTVNNNINIRIRKTATLNPRIENRKQISFPGMQQLIYCVVSKNGCQRTNVSMFMFKFQSAPRTGASVCVECVHRPTSLWYSRVALTVLPSN